MQARTLSGKFVLRLPTELHQALRAESERRRGSLNKTCITLIELGLEGNQFPRDRHGEAFPEFLAPVRLGVLRFGSVVRGEDWNSSDIDWLIVTPDDLLIDRSLYEKLDHIQPSSGKNSVHLAHLPNVADPSGFWLELSLEAEIIEDTSGLIKKRILELRRLIARGRYRRHLSHGQPYWTKEVEVEESRASR